MSLNYLFPIPFFVSYKNNVKDFIKEVEEDVKEKKFVEGRSGIVGNNQEKWIKLMNKELKEEIEKFSNSFGIPLELTDAWWAKNRYLGYEPTHVHAKCDFVLTLYLNFDPKEHSSVEFEHPAFDFYSFRGHSKAPFLIFAPKLETGSIIGFPAHLRHKTPLNKSKQDKIFIATHLKIKDKF